MNQNKKKTNWKKKKRTTKNHSQPQQEHQSYPDTCGKYFLKWNLMQEKKKRCDIGM